MWQVAVLLCDTTQIPLLGSRVGRIVGWMLVMCVGWMLAMCGVQCMRHAASVSRPRTALLWETMRAKEAREENQRVYSSEHTKVA